MRSPLGLAAAALVAVSALAPGPWPSPGGAAPLAAQTDHLVVIEGLGGTPEMEERFQRWAVRLVDAALERFELPADHVLYLAPRPEVDPERIDARSTREQVERVLGEMAERAGPDDRVMIVLIGHGSWDEERSRFALPGPDLTAEDFDGLLQAFGDRTVALVNTTSASGEFVRALSGPRRIVVTATATGRERNAPEFGRFFTEAYAGDGADADRDGTISLLEAFSYARTEVARHYEERNLLLTEHARLDDDGDGEGAEEPGRGEGDGSLAAGFVLRGETPAEVAADPELRALYEERRRLEEEVRNLRTRREEMEPEAYEDALEALLLELAERNREIRAREDAGPGGDR